MVTDLFGSLLNELGVALEVPNLHPDKNNTCQIKLKNGLSLQVEMDRSGQFVVLGADLGEVPPGKYRESIFREALKANDLPSPNHGTLAFSQKSEHLVLFKKLSAKDISGEKIATQITPFSEKGLLWKTALENGAIPAISQSSTTSPSAGMFGLRP